MEPVVASHAENGDEHHGIHEIEAHAGQCHQAGHDNHPGENRQEGGKDTGQGFEVGQEKAEHQCPAEQEAPQEAALHRLRQLVADQVNAGGPGGRVQGGEIPEEVLLGEFFS